jgi:MFS family permease
MAKIKNLYLLYSILILVSFTFAVRSSNNAFMTTIPLFVERYFHFSETDVGLIAGFSSLITFITALFINSRLNSVSRRYLFIIANIIMTIALLLIFYSDYISIWIYVLAIGFAGGIIMPNIITSAGNYTDRRVRERMMGIYTLALSASLIVGPAIEALFLEYFPLKYAFVLFVPISLIAVILSPFMKFPESKTEESKNVNVLSNPGFKVAIYSILTYNIPFAMIVFFSGIFAEHVLKMPYYLIMLLFSLLFAVSFISRILLSYFVPSNLWKYIKFSMFMTAVGLSVIFLSRDAIFYAIGIMILGIPHGLTYPLSISSIGRSFTIEKRNKANSYFFAVIMLIDIGIPSLAGVLIGHIGFRNVVMLIVPFIIVLFFLARNEIRTIKLNKLRAV